LAGSKNVKGGAEFAWSGLRGNTNRRRKKTGDGLCNNEERVSVPLRGQVTYLGNATPLTEKHAA